MSLTSYRAAPPRAMLSAAGRLGLGLRDAVGPRGGHWDRSREMGVLVRPGGDLLSRILRCSTIGAAALNGRVRDGIGCIAAAMATRPDQDPPWPGPRAKAGRPGFNIRVPSRARSKPDARPLRRASWCMLPDLWTGGALRPPGRHWVGSSLSDD